MVCNDVVMTAPSHDLIWTSWSYGSKIASFWVRNFKSDAKGEFSSIKKQTELPRQRFYDAPPKYCLIRNWLPNLVSVGTEIHFTPKSRHPHSRGSTTHLHIIYVRRITKMQPGLSPSQVRSQTLTAVGPIRIWCHMMSGLVNDEIWRHKNWHWTYDEIWRR